METLYIVIVVLVILLIAYLVYRSHRRRHHGGAHHSMGCGVNGSAEEARFNQVMEQVDEEIAAMERGDHMGANSDAAAAQDALDDAVDAYYANNDAAVDAEMDAYVADFYNSIQQ